MKLTKKLSFYEVNPRYFKDYTGNGIGDLAGLANKFDYFKYMGVDAIILQDVLSADEKGKEASFVKVASNLGDGNDVVRLVSLAKKHGKKLLIELNVGSIKENHNWFKSAQEKDVEEFKNVVEFHSNKENNELSYSYSSETKQYYVVDSKTQEVPLNWKSEQVLEHFVKVVRYWKEQGINGFVFKNFEYLADVEKKIAMSESTLKELRKFYRAIKEMDDDIIIVGKTDFVPIQTASQYTQGATKVFDYFMSTEVTRNGLDKTFGIDRIGKFSPSSLAKALKTLGSDNANIITFGSKFTGRVLSRWGNDGQYSKESAKALGMLLMLNKASSSIYYGDEIGTPNIGLTHLDNFQDEELAERKRVAFAAKVSEREFMDAQVLQNSINARALMAWDDSKNGGFSVAEKTITPSSTTYKEVNIKNQFSDDASVLLFFRELNRIVRESSYGKILEDGEYSISSLIPGVIKITSTLDDKEIKIFVNITDKVRPLLFRPKTGKVVLTTYHNKPYAEIPKKLEAYEGIVVSKHTDEYVRETQAIKISEEKAKKEADKLAARELAEKARIAEEEAKAKEEARIHAEQEKVRAKEEAARAKAKAEKDAFDAAQRKAIEEQKASLMAAKEAARVEKTKTQEVKVSKTQETKVGRTQSVKLEKTEEVKLNKTQSVKLPKTQEVKLGKTEEVKLTKTQEAKIAKTQATKLNKTQEVKVSKTQSTKITALKEAAKAERSAVMAHQGEKTTLREEELAKTTLIDDSIDLDELFAVEEKKRRGK